MIVTRNCAVELLEVEEPLIEPGHILMKTQYSAVSPGTELTMIGRGYDFPTPIGYSASGIVLEVGEGVEHVAPGDRVACYGGPYVRHAELQLIPKHLAVKVPSSVDMKAAAFVGLGAIGIHALRQGELSFGAIGVIQGLGILGQIMARIGYAAGYRIAACDLLESRCALLPRLPGLEVCLEAAELHEAVRRLSDGSGADAVLICAGGKRAGLIDEGIDMLRDRGTIVVVGDILTELTRSKMFGKEVKVVISRAGGPGRYDAAYEVEGRDYPLGYVRWTEGRNMKEYIRLLEEGRIAVTSLINKQARLSDMSDLYGEFASNPAAVVGAIVEYGD
ncbi:zinc-dependent alcohol dehydrogenase [Paenibacillus koleovorans]|uniref:zinc-dependent alcohol dehydrogenase n=1 Tax=Paenibacillus koleovorans TaxID=121608 RepID=UPI001FE4BE2F|nr:zinc-binding alcohol dehydrogenase [Paenibacillus koleovorans]